jgi:hypothetical protein
MIREGAVEGMKKNIEILEPARKVDGGLVGHAWYFQPQT